MPPQDKNKPIQFFNPYDPNAGFVNPIAPPQEQQGFINPYSLKNQVLSNPFVQSTISTISPILNFISRPSFGSAKFADTLLSDGKGILDALGAGIAETFAGTYFNPDQKQERPSYSDVINHQFPEFAKDNPIATQVLGFIGDIALDPTTYIGTGIVKSGVKLGSKVLTRSAEEVLAKGLTSTSRIALVGKDGAVELVEDLTKLENSKVLNKLKDTKIVDLEGNPQRYYHGTEAPDFDKFKTKGQVRGAYFSDNPDVASQYGNRIIPVFLDIKNPLNFDDFAPQDLLDLANKYKVPVSQGDKAVDVAKGLIDHFDPIDPLRGQQKLVTRLQKLGYDGIQFLSDDKGIINKQAIAFDPIQVKFALSNTGAKIRDLIKTKQGLEELGYFESVRGKQAEIEDFLNNFSTKADAALAPQLAKDETLADLKRFGKDRVPEELYTDEVRERVEKRIQSLADSNPIAAKEIFEPKGIYLKAGLPFLGQTRGLRLLGLEGISNQIKALSAYVESSSKIGAKFNNTLGAIGRAFSRDIGLPEEYIKLRDSLENELQYVVGRTIRDTKKLFTDITQEGRDRIGQAMAYIDDQTRLVESLRKGSSQTEFLSLTNGEAKQIFQEGIDKFKLTDTEKAVATTLRQNYNDVAVLEMRAKLLKSNLVNYSPRGYEVIQNADELASISRGKYNPQGLPKEFLASSQGRKYVTNAEAEAAGLIPEFDAALLYAHRVVASRRALEIKQFNDSIAEIFGTRAPGKTTIAHTGNLPTAVIGKEIPQRILDDMRLIGSSVYPAGLNEAGKIILKAVDKAQSIFKIASTTARPGFAPKQAVSNTIQSALVSGIKAFKAFDPRAFADAGLLLFRGGKDTGEIPWFLNNFITKNFTGNNGLDAALAGRVVLSKITGDDQLINFAKQFKLIDTFGNKYGGEELVNLARENGVIREVDSIGEKYGQRIEQELSNQNSYVKLGKELGKWWSWPSMVEDYSRMALFLNGIRMGKSARESAGLVNKALFDYSRGLSAIERNVTRRIIPFYSFQRFAIPFVLKETLKQPGNFATIEKVARTAEKLLVTGEPLNPGEENVFNGDKSNYLLSQPRLSTGFNDQGTLKVNILNNLTPFDSLNLFSFDEEGKVDYQKTAEKVFLGGLTPFLKIPLSAALGRDFFTQKSIEDASKYGDLEGSLKTILPEFVRDAIGWETRTNLTTGKNTTYISPFFGYYMMQVLPVLRDYIKGNEDVDYSGSNPAARALFSAMHMLEQSSGGSVLNQQKIDLLEKAQFEALKVKTKGDDLQKQMIKSFLQGSPSEYERHQQDLLKLFKTFGDNQAIRDKIRGKGIGRIEEGQPLETVAPVTPTLQQPAR